jgi:hypothetical protein
MDGWPLVWSVLSCLQAADFPEWMHSHFSPETLELLLGADISHTKSIATHPDGVALAPFEELYPALSDEDQAGASTGTFYLREIYGGKSPIVCPSR